MEDKSTATTTTIAIAILNGVVGDYLDASDNELAISMNFYRDGKPLNELLPPVEQNPSSASKLCILIHGLTDNETSCWPLLNDESNSNSTSNSGDYGKFLERDFGMEPFYLRYNTGLHVSTNGQLLNTLMNTLLTQYYHHSDDCGPEITFICHSMGGLVVRSALHYGIESDSMWVQKTNRVVFMGTPHHGSPWEQLGNVVSNGLGLIPLPYMKLSQQVANLRSNGIKDLRYGYILDEDDKGTPKKKAHLPYWITYYTVTGTVTKNPNHPISYLIGDALVRKPSAEGLCCSDDKNGNADHNLELPRELFCEFPGVSHCHLSKHPLVYEQIYKWFTQEQQSRRLNDCVGNIINSDDVDKDHRSVATIITTRAPPNMEQGWTQMRGVASLIQDAMSNGTSAVEKVHLTLADETFNILLKLKPTTTFVQNVKVVHDVSVCGVYGIIQLSSFGTTEIAKHFCDMMESRQKQIAN